MVMLAPFSYRPYKALGISASYANVSWLVYPAFLRSSFILFPILGYSCFCSLFNTKQSKIISYLDITL